MRSFVVVLALVAGCGGDDGDESPRETPCERLREHLIDLRLADATNVDQAAHRAAMRQALGTDFLASCAKLGETELACALDAPDASSATACSTATSRN